MIGKKIKTKILDGISKHSAVICDNFGIKE